MSKYEQLFSDVRKELNETRKELDAKIDNLDVKINNKVPSLTFWSITSGALLILMGVFVYAFFKLDKLNDYYINSEHRLTIIETQISEKK